MAVGNKPNKEVPKAGLPYVFLHIRSYYTKCNRYDLTILQVHGHIRLSTCLTLIMQRGI